MSAAPFDPYHKWLGIPPHEQPPHHYRLLGISPFESDPDVIDRAADARMTVLRSVQNGPYMQWSQTLLSQVASARYCLLNPELRAQYDAALRSALQPRQAAVAPVVSTMPAVTDRVPTGRRPRAGARGGVSFFLRVLLGGVAGLALGYLIAVKLLGIDPLQFADGARIAGGPVKPDRQPVVVSAESVNRSQTTPTLDRQTATENAASSQKAVSNIQPASGQPKRASKSPSDRANGAGQSFALVFGGQQPIAVELPADVTNAGAPFTIEYWVKLDPYEPTGSVLACGNVRMYCQPVPGAVGSPPPFTFLTAFCEGGGGSGTPLIERDAWIHVAIQTDEKGLKWFADGQQRGTLSAPKIQLQSPLWLGSSIGEPTLPGFCGMIRDLRVSRVARYANNFSPEPMLDLDDQTVVLLKLHAAVPDDHWVENVAGKTSPTRFYHGQAIVLNAAGEIAGELADGVLDLRGMASPVGLLEGGMAGGESYLAIGDVQGRSRVVIPYRPPAEYDIELELSRLQGDGGAFVGAEVAGRPVIVALDCFPELGRKTGILPADISRLKSSSALTVRTPIFTGEKPCRLKMEFRFRGTISTFKLIVEGVGDVIHQEYPVNLLSCPGDYSIPMRHGMSLGSVDANVRFHRVVVRPVTRDYSPEVAPRMRTAAVESVAAEVKPAPVTASPPQVVAQSSRQVLPEPEKVASSMEVARQIYESELKAATKAPQKAVLAQKILDQANQSQQDATTRYVLLELARKIFIQAGGVDPAVKTARLIEGDYSVPAGQVIEATLQALDDVTLAAEERGELARFAADEADVALLGEHYERSDKLAALAVQSAGKQRDVELRKEMAQRRGHVQRVVKEWTVAKVSLEKLKTEPTDTAARLAVGKFYCLTLEDFARGLPHLAKGSDAILAEAAQLDLQAKGDASKRMPAAAAWQQAASKTTDRDDKQAMASRERTLLEQAVLTLAGLELLKAQKRLDELKDVGLPRDKSAAVAASRSESARRGASLMGRLMCDGKETGVVVTYEQGYTIASNDVARLLSAAKLASARTMNLVLVGGFTVPSDQRVDFVLRSGGAAGQVFVDNVIALSSSPRSSTNQGAPMVRAGTHTVRWELAGDDINGARLDLRATNDGGVTPIPLGVDRMVEAAARKGAARATVHLGAQ